MGPNSDNVVHADPRVRTRARLLVVLTALIGCAALYLVQGFLRDMEALEKVSPQLVYEKLHPIGTTALGVTLVSSTVLAGVLVYVALCVVRAGQWPPPGFRVAWDMPIRRGRSATHVAVFLIFLAGVALGWVVLALNLSEPELGEQRAGPSREI